MNVIIGTEARFDQHKYTNVNVYLAEYGFRINDIRFDLLNSRAYRRTNSFRIGEGLARRALKAASIVSELNVVGSILDPLSPFYDSLISGVCNIIHTCKSTHHRKMQVAILSIIGLGNGFTPSGDDFLVGFLFCLNKIFMNIYHHCCTYIMTYGSTNWASRKFIEYAQMGFVVEPLERFVRVLLQGTEEEVAQSIENLTKVGHSSGLDSCLGAVIATSYLMGDGFCKKLTKQITSY